MFLHIGVDGCRGGWYAVRRDAETAGLIGTVYATFAELLSATSARDVVAVDIPIGLRSVGSRPCDLQARGFLAPTRSSSVFPAPLRHVLDSTSHADASKRRREIEGKGVSIQAYAITKKVKEVDEALLRHDPNVATVREVHPEVSFAAMNGNVPLQSTKKRAAGRAERTALLAAHFGDWPTRLVANRTRASVAADDVLDAVAALWSAERIGSADARSLPPVPDRDEMGLHMAIFY